MSARTARFAAALCGILGFAALGIYYSVPFPLPPPNATLDQLIADLHGYQNTIFQPPMCCLFVFPGFSGSHTTSCWSRRWADR